MVNAIKAELAAVEVYYRNGYRFLFFAESSDKLNEMNAMFVALTKNKSVFAARVMYFDHYNNPVMEVRTGNVR